MQKKFASFGMLGKHHTKATKRKMRKKALGKNNSQYGIHRFGKDSPSYGKPCSVSAVNLGRRFIGIEKDKDYYLTATERVKQAQSQLRLFEGG